jgi:hypothetical protein
MAMGNQNNVQKAEYLLKTILFDPAISNQLGVYEWASETSRWNELVAVLASEVCDRSKDDMMELTKYLADLGHLDIPKLAEIDVRGNKIDRENEEAGKIIDAFKRKDLSEEQALKVLLPLCQIAKKLSSDFGGKIQLCLRSYGETMLREALALFPLQGISEDEARLIFTAWLQKVTNMPLLLLAPEVSEFCRKHEISIAELIEAADNIDMNVAIVDELLKLWAND